MADAAYKCEEKEEKLVKDAVLHLTQANSQIKDLHHQFTHKVKSIDGAQCLLTIIIINQVDESSRQREEINGLLSQVCDLQKRVQKYSHENDDLTANLRVYQVGENLKVFYKWCSWSLMVIKLSTIIKQYSNIKPAYLV